jgi:hypothetical protein
MVIMLASGAVDRGFELQLGQTKDYKIGIWDLGPTTQSVMAM